jgi:hypothetical protein
MQRRNLDYLLQILQEYEEEEEEYFIDQLRTHKGRSNYKD